MNALLDLAVVLAVCVVPEAIAALVVGWMLKREQTT